MTKSSAEISEIVERTVEGLGFEFVELEFLPRGMMRVTIDTDREGGIAVDDCEAVSDQLTSLFAVEEINFDRLEVSSPGVERALKRVKDFVRFVGHTAHVELYEPMHAEGFPEAGRRKLDGRILGVEQNADGVNLIRFSFEEVHVCRTPSEAARARMAKNKNKPSQPAIEVTFAFEDIDRANLIAQLDFKGNK